MTATTPQQEREARPLIEFLDELDRELAPELLEQARTEIAALFRAGQDWPPILTSDSTPLRHPIKRKRTSTMRALSRDHIPQTKG